MYLLDTNICIDYVDGRSETARRRVEANFRKGLAISSITASELLVGARGSDDPAADAKRIDRFISVVRCHDYDTAAAREYALIAKAIRVNRKSFDRLIAAHALALGLVLVTSNVKHFADVPGLKVENWTLA
jgi:tRNA(fMet)-specific endonuclease VapC